MKNIKIVLGIALMILVVAGCSKKEWTFEEDAEEWTTSTGRRNYEVVPYENGFYYVNSQECLTYYDIDADSSVVLCEKNGCSHGGSDCFAHIDMGEHVPYVSNHRLYFISFDGTVKIAGRDNIKKETAFRILEKEQEKGMSLMLSDSILSNRYLYIVAKVSDYKESEDYGTQTEQIYQIDLKDGKETHLATIESNEGRFSLVSAKDGVLYYEWQSPWTEANTIEEQRQAERAMTKKIYRYENGQAELLRTIENGFLVTANDDIGIYYTEFLGNGDMQSKDMYHAEADGSATKIFSFPEGFSFGDKDGKIMLISVGNKHMLYDLAKREESGQDIDWDFDTQMIGAYPVPGGFLAPKEEREDGIGDGKREELVYKKYQDPAREEKSTGK